MPELGTRPRCPARHPARSGGCLCLACRHVELPAPHCGAGSLHPLQTPRDWAVQLGWGSGCLPAPTEAAPSQKDGSPGRDYIDLIFWEITCFLGTHGSPPKQGLKPPALALRPNQGRHWAVTACANEALPPLQRQPSVVPQPPLPPKARGCSVAGHDGAGCPPGLQRAG